MNKKILLIGARYSMNLGDDIIFDVVSDVCCASRGEPPVGLSISGLKGYQKQRNTSDYHRHSELKAKIRTSSVFRTYAKIKGCMRIKKALDELDLSQIDTVVFAGGQLFMDTFVSLIYVIVRFGEKNGLKVIFNCCGLGALSSNSIMLLQRIMVSPCVQAITLRDGVSRFKAIYAGHLHIQQTLDPAINCAKIYPIQPIDSRKKIGIGMISPETLKKHNVKLEYEHYVKLVNRIIKLCGNNGKECELFCNGDIRDYTFIQQIANELRYNGSIAPRPVRPAELVSQISSYSAIVSFRLHSHIVAASCGIPSVGLVWDQKVKEFFKAISREKWTFDVSDFVDFCKFDDLLNSFLTDDSNEIQRKLPNSCDLLLEMLSE